MGAIILPKEYLLTHASSRNSSMTMSNHYLYYTSILRAYEIKLATQLTRNVIVTFAKGFKLVTLDPNILRTFC